MSEQLVRSWHRERHLPYLNVCMKLYDLPMSAVSWLIVHSPCLERNGGSCWAVDTQGPWCPLDSTP